MNRPTFASPTFAFLVSLACSLSCALAGPGCATVDTGSTPDASQPEPDASVSTDASTPADAPVTPGIDAAPAIDATTPDAACSFEWVELLQNGSFDSGAIDWLATTNGSPIIRQGNSPWPPYDGDHSALFLGFHDGAQTLTQTVTVPASAVELRLQGFRCWVTEESMPMPYDTLDIELRDGAGELQETLWARDNRHADATCDWSMFQLSALNAYAGQEVTLTFQAASDGASYTSFGFDGLSLQANVCQ